MIFAPLVATITVLVIFVLLQLIIDTLRGRRLKSVSKHLLELGKRLSLTTISVVVREKGGKQQLLELLDHLTTFEYEKLQVVVVPRSRKPRDLRYLTEYRAAHPKMNIRIVRSAGRRDDVSIAKLHARGALVLWMDAAERLSPRFFERASYEFANTNIGQVTVPYRYDTARTIADLLAVWSTIRAETLDVIWRKKARSHRTIYRRSSFRQNTGAQSIVKPGTPIAIIRSRGSLNLHNLLIITGNVLLTAVLGYIAVYYLSTQWFFTVLAVISAYLLSHLFWLASSKRYSLREAIPLVLALPFAVIGNFASYFKKS